MNEPMQFSPVMSYNIDIAKRYGIAEAIITSYFLPIHNERMNAEGFSWFFYDEVSNMTGLSISQTKRAVKHLKKEGIIDVKRACIQDTKCTRAAISCSHFKFKQIKAIEGIK